MNANITSKNTDGNIRKHRKERHFYKSLIGVALVNGMIKEIVSLRLYDLPASTHCCLWINDSTTGTHCSGGGRASGWGYCRASSAAGEAFRNAGIELSQSISGVGMSAVEQAVEAVLKALGHETISIISSHS